MRAVEPPVVLMKGLKKFLREKRAGQKVDLYEDLEVREVIREELLKQVFTDTYVGVNIHVCMLFIGTQC